MKAKTLSYLAEHYPQALWVIGLITLLIGQFLAAFNKKKGDTISEFFDRLPLPAKFAIVGIWMAIVSHWCWPLPSQKK